MASAENADVRSAYEREAEAYLAEIAKIRKAEVDNREYLPFDDPFSFTKRVNRGRRDARAQESQLNRDFYSARTEILENGMLQRIKPQTSKKKTVGQRVVGAVTSLFEKTPMPLIKVNDDLARLLIDYSIEASLLKFAMIKATKLAGKLTKGHLPRDSELPLHGDRDEGADFKGHDAHELMIIYYEGDWKSNWRSLKMDQIRRREFANPTLLKDVQRVEKLVAFYWEQLTNIIPEKTLKNCLLGKQRNRRTRKYAVPTQEELDCLVYHLFYLWTRRAGRPDFTVQTLSGDTLRCAWPKPSFEHRPDLHAVVRDAAKKLRTKSSEPHQIETNDFDLTSESGTPLNDETFFAQFDQFLETMQIDVLKFMVHQLMIDPADIVFHGKEKKRAGILRAPAHQVKDVIEPGLTPIDVTFFVANFRPRAKRAAFVHIVL